MDHLRAYGDSDEEIDEEQQNDLLSEPAPSGSQVGSPVGDVSEPQPPRRPSYEDEKSDSSGNEDLVDAAIKDGMESLKADEFLSDREPVTPQSNVDSGGDGTPRPAMLYHAEVPPSPPGECNPEIMKTFQRYFERKAHGMKINESIREHKNFKNPALYEFLVEKYNIDEKGTNFPEDIFNPKRFKREDFYDHFRELDRLASEKAENQKKEQDRMIAEATAAVAAAAKKQKSRFLEK